MQFALALLADAVAAAEQAQPDEAINLTLLVEKALEGADSADARDARAAARLVRAGQLRVLGEVEAAEAMYRSVIADFQGLPAAPGAQQTPQGPPRDAEATAKVQPTSTRMPPTETTCHATPR